VPVAVENIRVDGMGPLRVTNITYTTGFPIVAVYRVLVGPAEVEAVTGELARTLYETFLVGIQLLTPAFAEVGLAFTTVRHGKILLIWQG